MKIEIYDPAMCCPTGVCGPAVDPELVRFKETLRQVQKQAPTVEIQRYSLSNDPQAYVDNAVVAELLKTEGPQCLPVVLVDGKCVSKRCYPENAQLSSLLRQHGFEVTLAENKRVPSCCGPGCC